MDWYLRETTLIAASYVLGCLSTGYYLVRFRLGVDVRHLRSGNVGARNVGRTLGKSAFVITLVGDTAKGAIPVAAALLLDVEQWVVMAAMVAAMAGHIWPLQLGLRGGKGLATAMGALFALDFRLVLLALAVAGVAWIISRNTTGSGLSAVLLTPIVALFSGHATLTAASLGFIAVVIIFTHRSNLRVIIRGENIPFSEET